jgi:hypothetical protein
MLESCLTKEDHIFLKLSKIFHGVNLIHKHVRCTEKMNDMKSIMNRAAMIGKVENTDLDNPSHAQLHRKTSLSQWNLPGEEQCDTGQFRPGPALLDWDFATLCEKSELKSNKCVPRASVCVHSLKLNSHFWKVKWICVCVSSYQLKRFLRLHFPQESKFSTWTSASNIPCIFFSQNKLNHFGEIACAKGKLKKCPRTLPVQDFPFFTMLEMTWSWFLLKTSVPCFALWSFYLIFAFEHNWQEDQGTAKKHCQYIQIKYTLLNKYLSPSHRKIGNTLFLVLKMLLDLWRN